MKKTENMIGKEEDEKDLSAPSTLCYYCCLFAAAFQLVERQKEPRDTQREREVAVQE